METLQEKEVQGRDLLIALRNKVLALVSQSESEELLAEAMAILSGRSLPCAYSHEQMLSVLREAEADYQNGDYVYTIGAKSIAPFRTRYGREDVIVFQQDTLTNLSICTWEGSPVMEVYRDGTLYTSYIDSNTQLSLYPEWFYRSRYLTAPFFASLEEGQYELQFAYTTSTDNNQLIPVYVNGIGEYRCQMTVTSDSIFFTLPDKQWDDITPPNPNDFVFTQLRGYYYPTKSDIFSSAWKLQLATQSFYSSTASNEMCIVFNAKGFYPDAMVGTHPNLSLPLSSPKGRKPLCRTG